jgi:hypothetical protein
MHPSGFTFTSASRHWNISLKFAIIHRVESSARRGLTFRSWKSASCLRRKRFSAASATRGRLEEEHEPTKVDQHLAKGTEEVSKAQGAAG